MIKSIRGRIEKEKPTGKKLDLAKEQIEKANKDFDKKGKLDEKEKAELKKILVCKEMM